MKNNTPPPVARVTRSSLTDHGLYLEAECGKTSATVGITQFGVQVICNNAMNKVWRGSGRVFRDTAAALEGYKSPAMKAIIRACDEMDR